MGLVNRVPQDPTARNNRVHVFRPGDCRRVMIAHPARHEVKYAMKHEPCEGFWETFLNVILQCVREFCQTEDNLSKNRKNRANTREPQKLTIKSHTPPLP